MGNGMSETETTARVVLVTGATSGIGRVCAEHLAARGWRVFGSGRRARDGEIIAGVEMLPMDVDDAASVDNCVSQILRRAGQLDAVVNNAGFSMRGAIEDLPIEDVKALFETNVFGVLRVCRATLPALREGGGHIVNIGSLAGVAGIPFTGIYGASKFALEGLTETLRYETRPFGVHVSIVEPGDFKTEIDVHRRLATPEDSVYRGAFERMQARRRALASDAPTPEPVAACVARILDDPAPKTRYAVAIWKQRAFLIAKRVLPQRVFEALLRRLLGL